MAGVAILMAAILAGCQPLEQLLERAQADRITSAWPALTPTPGVTVEPPAGCPGPGDGEPLADAVLGYSLRLPTSWSGLVPGDDAWIAVYGDHESTAERSMVDGTIQAFALALRSPDVNLLTFTVYVRDLPEGASLDALGDGYEWVLTEAEIDDYGPGTLLDRRDEILPAGPATRLEATLPFNGDPEDPTAERDADHVVAYVLQGGTRSYYLVERGAEEVFGRHADEFACMVDSFRVTPTP